MIRKRHCQKTAQRALPTRAISLAFLTVSLFAAGCSPDFREAPWTAYLVAYGESEKTPIRALVARYNRFKEGGRRDKTVKPRQYQVVLQADKQLCLVNTGPAPGQDHEDDEDDKREPSALPMGFTSYEDPVKLLENAGWSTGAVSDIILTHTGKNACGNVDRFSSATIHVQEEEYARIGRGGLCAKALRRFDRLGQLHLVAGDETILDGITVIEAGKATYGSQVVRVNTTAGELAFMGPLAPLQENIRYGSGPTGGHTWYGAAVAIRRMKRMGGTLVPSKDPTLPPGFVEIAPNRWKFTGSRTAPLSD